MAKKNATPSERRVRRITRQAAPTDEDARALLGLLRELAPDAIDEQIWLAGDFAARWIDQYRERLSGTSPGVVALTDARKQGRAELQAISKTIQKLKIQTDALSHTAKLDLLKSLVFTGHKHLYSQNPKVISVGISAGMDDFVGVLRRIGNAASSAASGLRAPRPSKHWNPDNFLACGMAETLGAILQLKIAMTREGDPAKLKRTSANYWRLLKLAFEVAGTQPPEDLRPIMKAGLELAGLRARQERASVRKRGK